MAIGLEMVLGFTFPRNFRMPCTSLSITEFLAALAHVAGVMAARLSVHSTWRQPRFQRADLPQSRHGVPAVLEQDRRDMGVRDKVPANRQVARDAPVGVQETLQLRHDACLRKL